MPKASPTQVAKAMGSPNASSSSMAPDHASKPPPVGGKAPGFVHLSTPKNIPKGLSPKVLATGAGQKIPNGSIVEINSGFYQKQGNYLVYVGKQTLPLMNKLGVTGKGGFSKGQKNAGFVQLNSSTPAYVYGPIED